MTGAGLAARVYGGLWAATVAGVAAGALVGGTRPAPTIEVTTGALFVDVVATNARLVAAITLAAVMVAADLVWRAVLDVVIAAMLAVNMLAVGAAIGATGVQLTVSLAHLPIEWAAFAVATAAYLEARCGPVCARQVAARGFGALALVLAGAGVEACGPRLG